MMKIIRNRLKKCCTPTQIGSPTGGSGFAGATPGFLTMNPSTAGTVREPFAATTATTSSTRPIGRSHSRLNHRERPTRTRGAMPRASGTDPAQVAGSITSSPAVSSPRYCSPVAGASSESEPPFPVTIRTRSDPRASRPPCRDTSPPWHEPCPSPASSQSSRSGRSNRRRRCRGRSAASGRTAPG